jgi:hypothetical protein
MAALNWSRDVARRRVQSVAQMDADQHLAVLDRIYGAPRTKLGPKPKPTPGLKVGAGVIGTPCAVCGVVFIDGDRGEYGQGEHGRGWVHVECPARSEAVAPATSPVSSTSADRKLTPSDHRHIVQALKAVGDDGVALDRFVRSTASKLGLREDKVRGHVCYLGEDRGVTLDRSGAFRSQWLRVDAALLEFAFGDAVAVA